MVWKLWIWKNKKQGTLFNLKDTNKKSMSFFSRKEQNIDTLYIKQKNYKFLNLKEIRKKEIA